MASDEPSGARPAGPVVLRIKLRYDDVEAMIARFAPNVGKTGLFLPTKSLQPIGAEIKFELRLANDQPVLVGLGRVKAVRQPDPDNPKATFGMAVELMRVTRESRDLILKMLERRKQLGLPETALPMPVDIDAARRSDFIDTGIKDYTSGAVPQLVAAADSAPSLSEPLLTAPRRQTGPIAVAKVALVEPLAPEPARKKRVPVAELIASASGPIAIATDPLDEHELINFDLGAALARARVLAAGTDLDGELEALRDAAAAPLAAINIEAASAELARTLGGAAVRRDRSGATAWAPPPPTASEPVAKVEEVAVDAQVREPDEITRAADEPTPVMAVEERVPPPDDEDDDALFEQRPSRRSFAPENVAIKTEPSPGAMIHDGADAAQFGAESADDGAQEVDPEQIADEIHRLDEGDFEEVEHTQIGAQIDPGAFEGHAYATVPSEQVALADKLDAHLAQAEADAERDEDLGFAGTVDHDQGTLDGGYDRAGYDEDGFDRSGYNRSGERSASEGASYGAPAYDAAGYEQPASPESSGGFSLEDPPASGDYVIGLHQLQQHSHAHHDADALEVALRAAVDQEAQDEEEIEEIDDFEILAEADAEDADLLAAAAEQEVSGGAAQLPPNRPSFLSRLELDDDSSGGRQLDEFSHEPGEIDPRLLSAGHALRAFEDPDEHSDFNAPGAFTPVPSDPFAQPVGEASYTFAGDVPADEFDEPHGNYAAPPSGGFVPPDAFDQSDVIVVPPPATSQRDPRDGEDFPDLESALEALDVDLDDLGGLNPGGRAQPRRARSAPVVRAGRNRNTPPGAARAVTPDDIPTARGPNEVLGTSPTEHASTTSRRQSGPGRVHKRATTEDGIVIDFDDED